MDSQTQNRLIDLNRQFYNQFAGSFSETRNRAQPGVRQRITALKGAASILDVGCGNGTLARALERAGYTGAYLGVDISAGLLDSARQGLGPTEQGEYAFQQVDLSAPDWPQVLPQQHYEALVSFAVLHHLPGDDLRLRTAQIFHSLAAPQAPVAVSVWQWQNSPRLAKRVVPWTEVDLAPEDVDEGDVLLDWRASGQVGLRYVHTFSEASLTHLAKRAGFKVNESFLSDGKPGNLALYQVWQPL